MLPLTDEMLDKIRKLGIDPDKAAPFIQIIMDETLKYVNNFGANKKPDLVSVKRHDENGSPYMETVHPTQVHVELIEALTELTDTLHDFMQRQDDLDEDLEDEVENFDN